jgi:pimeloyl-ACP methyl ester carboxylesterase
MDHLGIESVRAIGISTGAMTLLHMATQQPERVEAMVLVGVGTYYPAACRERVAATSADTYPESGWSRLRRLHLHGDDQIRSLLDLFGSFASDYEDMAFTPPRLATIRARTLIVNGDRDWCFPTSMAAEMAEAIPSAYLWVIPNGRHVPVLRHWSRTFTATAVAFLGGNLERG